MVATMEQANKGAEKKLEETSENASTNGNKVSSGDKLYTEAELQAKLSEAQRTFHRSEVQPLRDQIKTMQTERTALESQLSESESNVEALKSTVAELHNTIEEGLPEDAKEALKKWGSAHTDYAKKVAQLKREYSVKDKEYESQRERVLEIDAKELLAKYPNSGVSVETLVAQGNQKDMKLYLYDYLDNTGWKPAAPASQGQATIPEPTPEALPRPGGTAEGGGTEKSDEQIYREMYPSMYPK